MLSFARTSLEEMLESLRQRDGGETPQGVLPALPSQSQSKARVISGRWTAQSTFSGDSEDGGVEDKVKKNTFWGNKRRKDVNVDSPYNSEEVTGVLEESDNIGYFIEKKLHVWCRQPRGVWVSGTIESTSGEESVVSLANGNLVEVSTSHLFPANPEILDGVDDLMHLSYLNEPSVLHNLKYRYSRDMIYSKAGAILIAVNPFRDVEIYGKDFITAYKQKAIDRLHVFALADTAYNKMMNDGVNQSLIISGECGAGKTETAKFAMQYLASLGCGNVEIERRLLQASCILEAFGNAKTTRNDNASRFGKLMEIHFTELGEISGANIQTFLLEKLRVVQLAPHERSYHIFYQLCAGASQTLRERLHLKKADEYNYLAQSDFLVINGVDDAQEFHKLMEALDTFQFSKEEKDQVFEMLGAVLWLGNITFQVIDYKNHVEASNDEALIGAARLLGCGLDELKQALSTHRVQPEKDSIVNKLTLKQATDARDALAKCIYACLFDCLVEHINKSLKASKQRDGRSLSIIDIYGFESFKKNSFEQLCINYANERLQQYFNWHLLKLEQEEYELDGIDGVKVDFVDNQECLDLFEKKPFGLLSLLDEELNSPDANDSTLTNKLKQHLSGNSCFKGDKGRAFGVRHFAGEVLYDTNDFLKKSHDTLNTELVELLSSCEGQYPQTFAIKMLNQSLDPDAPKQGVGTQLKHQLFKLMHQLENTKPHFIFCVKPNRKQLSSMYDEDLVLHQLVCCSVFEVVRISRSGYPARMTHQKFAERYGSLLLETNVSQDPLSISSAVLKQFNVLPEMYQIGYTKLYLRIGLIGVLEDRRKQALPSTVEIQAKYINEKISSYSSSTNEEASSHSPSGSQLLDELLAAIVDLQSLIRGCLVRNHLSNLRALGESRSTQMMSIKNPQVMDIPNEQPSAMEELQRRVLDVEATLGQKEQENATLWKQLQQYEAMMQGEQEIAALRERLQQYEEKMQKEQENATLRDQLQQENARLHEQIQQYEAKMQEEQGTALREQLQQYEANMQKEQENATWEQLQQENATLQKQLQQYEVNLQKEQENAALLEQLQQENATLQKQLQQYEVNLQKEQENAALREQLQHENATLQKQLQQYEANMQEEQEIATLREQLQQYEEKRQQEQENATVREQLQQYEAKMKKMEETLQKQNASLQASLAAAKKSGDSSDGQLGRGYADSKVNVSMQPQSPGGDTPDVRDKEDGVSNMVKEFEQQKQTFEVDMNQTESNVNSYEELRKLKHRFRAWKKDFKMRLRELKAKLQKQGYKESDKTRKKWWPKRGKGLQIQTCTKPPS